MYTTVLVVHNWIRWVALVAAIGATFAALRRQTATAERWGLIAMMTLDIQMLLGLLLYLALSPNTAAIMNNFGGAMKDPVARFWAVEHVGSMFVAVIAAHVGRVLARKAATPDAKARRLLIAFAIASLFMILGMPWPGRPGGRPLFRIS
jgi:hypothetical protein